MRKIAPFRSFPEASPNGSGGWRPCEKTIAAVHWAIYCRRAGLLHAMMRGSWSAVALVVTAGRVGHRPAHEFIAKPGAMTVQAGAELQVAGLSSHVFLISQELEAPKDVKVGFHADGKRTDIAVKPNEKTLAYDRTVTVRSSGTFIVTGACLPQIWATTVQTRFDDRAARVSRAIDVLAARTRP